MDDKTQHHQQELEKAEHFNLEDADLQKSQSPHQDLAEAAGIEDRVRLEKKLVRKIGELRRVR
jgi:hypothetical protein